MKTKVLVKRCVVAILFAPFIISLQAQAETPTPTDPSPPANNPLVSDQGPAQVEKTFPKLTEA